MADILLIQPPVRDFYLTPKRSLPYGLASIAAAARQQGFRVCLLDALATRKSKNIDWPRGFLHLVDYYGRQDLSPFALFHRYRHFGYSYEHIGRQARLSGALLVGISSLFTAYADEALETAAAVKRFHPDCRIVMGGHHPTCFPARSLASPHVDMVIRGEGEVALPELARRLRSGAELSSIPGICFQAPAGGLHISAPAVVDPLDSTPLPASDLIHPTYYRRRNQGAAVVVASRGCPLTCSYCALGAPSAPRFRRRRLRDVLTEIQRAVEGQGARFIDFEDENISHDRRWFLRLLTQIRQRHGSVGIELRAMNGLYPPSLDPEVIRAMQAAGFRTLNLALATLCPTQLKRFRRPDVRPALESALSAAHSLGLDAVAYIIVGAPGQRGIDSLQDLLYLARRRVLAGVSVFYPAPGSRDFERCRQWGLLPRRTALMRATALPIDHTTTRSESATLLRLGRIVNFMKSIRDRGESFPAPSACHTDTLSAMDSRRELGRRLLSWFFYDGKIRGVEPSGRVFVHRTAGALTRAFIHHLPPDQVCGVKTYG